MTMVMMVMVRMMMVVMRNVEEAGPALDESYSPAIDTVHTFCADADLCEAVLIQGCLRVE